MTRDQHLDAIVAQLFPEFLDDYEEGYKWARDELAQLPDKLLERITDRLARLYHLTELRNQMVAWANEHKAEE